MTSGIQHPAQLAWAHTGTVIGHRSFQSPHPVHLGSSESGILLTEDTDVPQDLPSAPMPAVEPQAPVPSQHCQESWVSQVEPANLSWDLLGFNSKHAWLNSRFCPLLKLSFTQSSPSFPPVIRQASELRLPGTQQGCAPPLAHKYPQHSDSLAPAPPDFVVRPLRMWETLLHFLSLLQKMQITSL